MPGEPKNDWPLTGTNPDTNAPVRPDDRGGLRGAGGTVGSTATGGTGGTTTSTAGGTTTSTTGGTSGIADGLGFTIRSDEELQKIADQQIGAEIEGAVSPLQSQVTGLQDKEGRVLGDIGNMFDKLQPGVQAAADATTGSWQDAQNIERDIFSTATQKLNDLKQQRAVEAQTLAQQMGGPVALGEFTDAVTPEQSYLANMG